MLPKTGGYLGSFNHIADYLFGYDYFISYSHRDGTDYPKQLAQRLKNAGYTVFLDKTNYHPGTNLGIATGRRVRMSKYLLIVGRTNTYNSLWVEKEIRECIKSNRIPILININNSINSVSDQNTVKQLLKDRIYVDEFLPNSSDTPSNDTISKIASSFKSTRQEKTRVKAISFAAILFAVIAVFAMYKAYDANQQQKEALYQKGIALDSSRVAQTQRENAIREAQRARDSSRVAQEQRFLADSNARVAVEQTEIAIAQKEQAIRETKEKEMRLSEVYWSYAKNYHDKGQNQLAQLYAAEAAILLPNRGYGASYQSISQDVHRYLLQNISFVEHTNFENIKFERELITSERIRSTGKRIRDFSDWPITASPISGAFGIPFSPNVISWHDDSTVVVRDVHSLAPKYDRLKFRDEIIWAWIGKKNNRAIIKLEDEDDDWFEVWDMENGVRIVGGENLHISTLMDKIIAINKLDNNKYELRTNNLTDNTKKELSKSLDSAPLRLAWTGNLLAVVTKKEPNIITFHSTNGEKEIPSSIYQSEPISHVNISVDKQHILAASQNGIQYLWVRSLNWNKKLLSAGNQHNFDNPGFSMGAFSSSSEEFLIWSQSNMSLVNLDDKEINMLRIPTSLSPRKVFFSPDASYFAIIEGKNLELWNKKPLIKKYEATLNRSPSHVQFAPNSTYLLMATDNDINALNVPDGTNCGLNLHLESEVSAMAITHSNKFIAIADNNGSLHIWDQLGTKVNDLEMKHTDPVRQCRFILDDKYLLCIGADTKLWHIADKARPTLKLQLGSWKQGSVTLDGKRLLIWKGTTAQLVDLPSGEILAHELNHEHLIKGGCAASGGNLFRTWDTEGDINTWWSFSGSPMGQLRKPGGIVRPRAVVNAPEGNALLYFDYDDGLRTTYIKLASGDEDFPEAMALLQSQALLGIALDDQTGKIISIPSKELFILRKNYIEILKLHYSHCAMPKNNLYPYLSHRWETRF